MINLARARIVQAGAVAAAALLAATAAAPLQAASADQRPAAEAPASANSERRICAMVDLPSSRMPRRVCRTQAEWNRAGGVPAAND